MRSLLRVGVLRRYLGAYAVIQSGFYFSFVAVAVLVYSRTDSAVALAAVMLCGEIVPALVSPAIVGRVERLPARTTLSLAWLLQGLAYAGLLIVVAAGVTGPALIATAMAMSLVEGVCGLVARSLLRSALFIRGRELALEREVNAAMNAVMTLAMAGAPALAGLLIAGAGLAWAFGVCAGALLGGAAIIALSPSLRTHDADDVGDDKHGRGMRGSLARLRAEHRPVLVLLAAQTAAVACFAAIAPVEVILIDDYFGGAEILGGLLAIWGAGAAISAALYARRPQLPLAPLAALSTVALGVGFIVMGSAPYVWVLYAGALLAGAGNGVQWVAVMSAMQQAVPDALQARVASLAESGASLAPAIGYLAGALVASQSSRAAMIACGVGALLCAGWLLRCVAAVQTTPPLVALRAQPTEL